MCSPGVSCVRRGKREETEEFNYLETAVHVLEDGERSKSEDSKGKAGHRVSREDHEVEE